MILKLGDSTLFRVFWFENIVDILSELESFGACYFSGVITLGILRYAVHPSALFLSVGDETKRSSHIYTVCAQAVNQVLINVQHSLSEIINSCMYSWILDMPHSTAFSISKQTNFLALWQEYIAFLLESNLTQIIQVM